MNFGVYDLDAQPLERSTRPHTATRWNSSVQRVLAYMQSHLEERQSSMALASIGALSRFHFTRVFRHLTGIPPGSFLTALRLESAKWLLLTTDLSVTEICLEVGYTSLGTFVSRFTQMVGLSPNALRRMARDMDGADLRKFFIPDRPAIVAGGGMIHGRIAAPSNFIGAICIGVYETLLPHAKPIRCARLTSSGDFVFGPLPHRSYVLAAAALPYTVQPVAFLNRGVGLRVASRPISVGARKARPITLELRPTSPFDPPILAPLPAMFIGARQTAGLESWRSSVSAA